MFQGFANVWTAVTLARRLRRDRPLMVELAGEKLVFFRGEDGRAGALVDRCPHRGVRLSLGKVKGGCLECPFHAWQFDPSGQVREVPLNPDAKRHLLAAQALPTRELGGLLWVYTAPGPSAPSEPMVPDALIAPDLARTSLEVEWKAHWTRAMENMLDAPHVPYVHRATIGRFTRRFLKPGSTMHVTLTPTEYGARSCSWIDDHAGGERAWLDYYRPNIMVLTIPVPNQTFRMHALCVPVDQNRVRMIVVGARSFAKAAVLNPFFNASNRKIVREDQAVVESSWPVEVPPAADERSVRTDQVTLFFRRYYYETLKPSRASPT